MVKEINNKVKHTLIKTLDGYKYYGVVVKEISDLRSIMLEGIK